MKKEFIERVWKECIVDTRNYRYVLKMLPNHWYIERCPLDKLNVLPQYGSYWKTIYTYEDND